MSLLALNIQSNALAPPANAFVIPEGLAVPRLHRDLLVQCAIIALPLPAAFLLDHPDAAGTSVLAVLGIFLAYHALKKQPFHFLCLLVSSIPSLTVIRGSSAPFPCIAGLLLLGVAWLVIEPGQFKEFWKRKTLLWSVLTGVVYWWASFLLSGHYDVNFRVLECVLSISVCYMLCSRRSFMANAMLGLAFSTIGMGIGFLPYSGRLGMAVVEGLPIGNPINLGLPAALVLLLSIAERGRWLLLHEHPLWRTVLGAVSGAFLILSTSRGSWLVALVGIAILVCTDRRARTPLLATLALIAAGMVVLSGTQRGEAATHYLMKVISPDTSLAQKTTGRILQWDAFPQVFRDSPVWGFGPGSGRAVSDRYSGKNIVFHSLYLQIGAETGMIGLAAFALLLGVLIHNGWSHYRDVHEIVPLLATFCFMTIGLSVSAFDSISGLVLGFGLVAGSRTNFWAVHGMANPGPAALVRAGRSDARTSERCAF